MTVQAAVQRVCLMSAKPEVPKLLFSVFRIYFLIQVKFQKTYLSLSIQNTEKIKLFVELYLI